MGEIADMMIDGLLDAYTGEYLDGKEPGFPRYRKGGAIVPVYGRQYNPPKQGPQGEVEKWLKEQVKTKKMPRLAFDVLLVHYGIVLFPTASAECSPKLSTICKKIKSSEEQFTAFKEWTKNTYFIR